MPEQGGDEPPPLQPGQPLVHAGHDPKRGLLHGATSCQGQGYFGKRSFISGMTQSGGWPDATRWTLA
jgi:hypothetical protein